MQKRFVMNVYRNFTSCRTARVCVYVCNNIGFKQISLAYTNNERAPVYDEPVDCVCFYVSTNLIKR